MCDLVDIWEIVFLRPSDVVIESHLSLFLLLFILISSFWLHTRALHTQISCGWQNCPPFRLHAVWHGVVNVNCGWVSKLWTCNSHGFDCLRRVWMHVRPSNKSNPRAACIHEQSSVSFSSNITILGYSHSFCIRFVPRSVETKERPLSLSTWHLSANCWRAERMPLHEAIGWMKMGAGECA